MAVKAFWWHLASPWDAWLLSMAKEMPMKSDSRGRKYYTSITG